MHHNFVLAIAQAIAAKRYLELGLYKGKTFSLVANIVDDAVGVDTVSRFTPIRGTVYTMTTDEFFRQNTSTFDMIFIDADHTFDSARRDLLSSLNVLNPYGVIVMHDTDPTKPELLDSGYCGDSYRLINWVYEYRPDLNILTLPIEDPGLSMIMRKSDRRIYTF